MHLPDAGAAGRPQGSAGRLWVVATPLAELVPALKSGSLKGEFTVAIAPAGFAL